MLIHIIGTINGQTNEGMRNIATHLSREFEKNNKVLYSGLKQLPQVILNSLRADTTLIFARANKMVYYLAFLVSKICENTWVVLVQKPDVGFLKKIDKYPLNCNYLSITESDLQDVKVCNGKSKKKFPVGIKKEKFTPISSEAKKNLKLKYGFNPEKPLVIHVGHCSKGRGLEDFSEIQSAQKMVIASGMFEDENVVKILQKSNVRIHKGYLENVEEIYQMADVYLFPTRSTEYVISIPLSVMEALSCGVPVIGYRSFANLQEIKGKKGAITLIDNANELNTVIPQLVKRKQDSSLLYDARPWSDVAKNVLSMIQEVN